MELQAAFISVFVSTVGGLATWLVLSARTRHAQRQRDVARVQAEAARQAASDALEAKRQQAEEDNRKFLVQQVDRAIANADDARKIADSAKQEASHWKALTEGLQEQLNSASQTTAFMKKQIEELTATLLEHKTLLAGMPGMEKMIAEQKLLIDILSAQLDNIPKLEREIERLHKQVEDQAKQIGQLENKRGETVRLLDAERKIHRLNESQWKQEIARLTAEVRDMSEENARLKMRVVALEISSPVSTNSNPTVKVEEKI